MPWPNFFLAGAPKAGTDLLFYQLDQHPEIYMSPLKEPCYFSAEIRLKNFHASLRPQAERAAASLRRYLDHGAVERRFGGIVAERGDYLRLFDGVREEKAIGEGSVCYLWSKTAAAAIREAVPQARIVLVLMDPAERAFQQYLKSISDGAVGHRFCRHLEMAFADLDGPESQVRAYHPFLAFGQYTQQVRRYLEQFPRERIFISLYEDMQKDYCRWFARLLSFLGVDDTFAPPVVEAPSTPHLPRFPRLSHALHLRGLRRSAGSVLPAWLKESWKCASQGQFPMPVLPAEDRMRLVAYYREDILTLQDLIQRDLSAWLC